MATITYQAPVPAAGDTVEVTLRKILQRLGNLPVTLRDSDILLPRDAFNRLRVGMPRMLSNTKQLIDYTAHQWDDVQASGGGTGSTHAPARASTILSVSATTPGRRVRQTFRRFNYYPGRSQQFIGTAILGAPLSGITRRWGYFDNSNGLFIQQAGGAVGFVLRSAVSGAPVDTVIPQAAWNVDRMDGSGPSAHTLDLTKIQILFIEFEWLGGGIVNFGFFLNGTPWIAHTIDSANHIDSVFMSTPNLPIRYELTNDGTGQAATFETICAVVNSEGGDVSGNFSFSAHRGTTPLTTLNDSDLYPLVGVRLRSGQALNASVALDSFSLMTDTTTPFQWLIVRNPTLTGTAPVWATASPAVESATATTNGTKASGGIVMASGYGIASSGPPGGVGSTPTYNQLAFLERYLGVSYAGVSDQFWLCVRRLSADAEAFYGSLNWIEEG